MANISPRRTAGQVVVRVAELTGDLLSQGTLTAATTTTATDANNEKTPVADATAVTGTFYYAYGGTGAGDARLITTYGTLGVFTWTQAVAAAHDTTTTWIRVKRDPRRIIDTIAGVTRDHARAQAVPYDFMGLVTNNLLESFGDVETWPNGTTSVPEGWGTLVTATVAQLTGSSAVTPRQGLYAVAVTDDGSAGGYMPFTIAPRLYTLLEGQTLYLRGFISQSAASVGRLRLIATDEAGTDTAKNWDADQTGNRWIDLEDVTDGTAGLALPSTISNLVLRLTALTASGVVRADDLMLYGPSLYDYELPASMVYMEPQVYLESGYRTRRFNRMLEYGRDFDIIPGDFTVRPRLVFYESFGSGRHLWIRSLIAPAVVTAAATNVEADPEWLAHAAAARLLAGDGTLEAARRLADLRPDLQRLERSPAGNHVAGTPYIPLLKV